MGRLRTASVERSPQVNHRTGDGVRLIRGYPISRRVDARGKTLTGLAPTGSDASVWDTTPH